MKARDQEPGVRSQASVKSSPALSSGFVILENPTELRDTNALVAKIPSGIRSKEKLLAVFSDKLRFPKYFGWNWDALEECLRDLSWLPSNQSVAIVHADLPFGAGGVNRQVYLAVLQSAIDHWSKTGGHRLTVAMPAAVKDILSTERRGD
jgi:RNAse (barnase) inhibitor barstar